MRLLSVLIRLLVMLLGTCTLEVDFCNKGGVCVSVCV